MKRRLMILLVLVAVLGVAACGSRTSADSDAAPASSLQMPAIELPGATLANAPTATPTAAPAIVCAGVPRPALILGTGASYELHNPFSGERCPLPLPQAVGYLQPGGDYLYFLDYDREASTNVAARLSGNGTIEPLEPTRASGDVHYLMRIAVAPDGRRLAWSHMTTDAAAGPVAMRASLWIGAGDGRDAVAILENQSGGESRVVAPLRFTEDGSLLYFTWEPTDLGGMWSGYNGRYDNLYRVAVAGGEPQKVFDCADTGLFLCAGDFRDDGTVTYIDTSRVIHVIGPDGAAVAAIPTTAEYAGYPTFSPTGDLYYTEATLPPDDTLTPVPAPGTVYRLAAPYTGTPEVVATADGLLAAGKSRTFLDAGHLVVSATQNELWGPAVMASDGEITPLPPGPNASLAAIWPAGQ